MAKFSMCSPWTSINALMLDHRRDYGDSLRILASHGRDAVTIM
jgi:hypothetical protein